MKTSPSGEQALPPNQRIPVHPVPPQGSIDEGVQPARVPVGDDQRLKKIWVYADGEFTPQSASDYRIVRVRTDAFDLSGWVYFGAGAGQNQYETEVRVTMANASNVLVQTSAFGPNTMAKMRDMCGQDTIAGNFIDIVIKQTYSADNFATKTAIAYQFVVESC